MWVLDFVLLFSSQDYFVYSEPLAIPCEFIDWLFHFYQKKKSLEFLLRLHQICRSVVVLQYCLLTHGHRIASICLDLLSFLSAIICRFPCASLLLPCLHLFLGILFFWRYYKWNCCFSFFWHTMWLAGPGSESSES